MEWVFLFKQKTAYEWRISDWSSDVCSSDLVPLHHQQPRRAHRPLRDAEQRVHARRAEVLLFKHVDLDEIGRASCRERVCQYVSISVVAVSLKKKRNNTDISTN